MSFDAADQTLPVEENEATPFSRAAGQTRAMNWSASMIVRWLSIFCALAAGILAVVHLNASLELESSRVRHELDDTRAALEQDLRQGNAGLAAAVTHYAHLRRMNISIFDANGQRIAHAEPIRSGRPQALDIPMPAGPSPSSIRLADGRTMLVSTSRGLDAKGAAISLVVAISEQDAFAQFEELKRRTMMIALVFSLSILLLFMLLSRMLEKREKSERELRAREASLRRQHLHLVEAQRMTRCGSWTWHSESDLLFPSAEYLALFQMDAAHAPRTMREWDSQFVDSESREMAQALALQRSRGESYQRIYLAPMPDGSRKWLQVLAQPVSDGDGKLSGYVGVTRDISEERKAERQLADRAKELEDAKRIARLGVWSWEMADDTITVCERVCEIYDVSRIGCPGTLNEWTRRFERPENAVTYLGTSADTGTHEPVDGIRPIVTAKGTPKWVQWIGGPTFDPDGKLVGYHGIVRDVTHEKNSEHRLAQSEERYRMISEHMKDIVALHDASGNLLYCSPSLSRMLGYSIDPSRGERLIALIHRKDRALVRNILAEVVGGHRQVATVEFRIRHRNGHFCWLETVVAPVINVDGTVKHYQTASRDISRRKEAETALRASEERFRSLTELVSDWIWEQDNEFRFTFFSREVSTAARPLAALGNTRWDLFPDAMSEAEWTSHRADLAACRPFYGLVMRITDPHSGAISAYQSISGEPIFNEGGGFIGYRGTGHDITDRKRAEDALAKRTRELATINSCLEEEVARRQQLERDFLMAIENELAQVGLELHDDLGQDLTGIALLTKALEGKLHSHGFGGSQDAARISALVNRTIKHTRMISHGLSPYIWGSGGLVPALNQLANDIDSLGVVKCSADLTPVDIRDEVAARSLYRIAQESVNNALKHGQAKHIRIKLEQQASDVHLCISDDGIGRDDLDGIGLRNDADTKFHSIRHRASAIDGALLIERGRLGGTDVHVRWQSTRSSSVISLRQHVKEAS